MISSLRLIVPALLVGLFAGYFLGRGATGSGKEQGKLSPRAAFLSTAEDEVNYEKLARVCLTAAQGQRGRTAPASAFAEPGSEDVLQVKKSLDELMSLTLEKGVWSRGAGFRAKALLRRLPAADVAEFENLLSTTLKNGNLTRQPGAWVPQTIN